MIAINYAKASFKDFENIPDLDAFERAEMLQDFLQYMKTNGHLNYRLQATTPCGPELKLANDTSKQSYVSFVSNDYLGFTQHPEIKKTIISSIEKYGSGAGASPLIGGHYEYHEQLEDKLSEFFKRPKGSSIIYTTGYTANSASLMSLLQKEDIAILDMAVHASVYEGCSLTNTRRFLHNNMEALERILKDAQHKYRTKLIVVDGVYSQDGDIARIPEIVALARKYGAFVMVDDAHGIGVIGKTGRGALEEFDMLHDVDIITGTFSKTFANIGGYFIANPALISFLQYQSRQNAFSAAATPAIAGVTRAIELIDEQPEWNVKLWDNINYFKAGLQKIGLDVGTTNSAIIPVKIGDPKKTGDAGRMLLESGIYTNPILYPAVSKKDARIRMSIMATHTKKHLDHALNAFEDVNKKLDIAVNVNPANKCQEKSLPTL